MACTNKSASDLISTKPYNSLVDSIYPDIDQGEKNVQYFLDHNILACTNSNVMDLNAELLEKFPGEKNVDSVELDNEAMNQ